MNVVKQILKSIQAPPANVVKIIAVRQDGKILILRRSRVISITRQNDLPGGIVDKGEDRVEAIRRETEEETGLKLNKLESLGNTSFWSAPIGPVELFGYVCDVEGEVKLSWEHDKYWWASPQEALEKFQLRKPYKALIEKYVENLSKPASQTAR